MNRKFAAAASLIVAFAGISLAADEDLKSEVVRAHGFDQFDQVEEIRFTFAGRTSRSWEWRVDDNVVTYREEKEGAVTMITYDRDELRGASEAVIATDRKFVNDSFWLAWPLHASWASDATITRVDEDTIKLSYAPTGAGYTPGDTYVIDVDESGLATKWAFHKGGAEQAGLTNSIEDYVTLGPLKFATMHQNESGFKLEIKDLAVKLRGETEWITPKP